VKYDEKRDIAEFITRGMDDFGCFMLYSPKNLHDHDAFGRQEAIERIAKTWSGAKLRAERDAKLASNARGDLETYVTMTVDGGYGAEFQAYSWYHADEQARENGYVVLDWTEGMDEKHILVVQK
jgi:hypothetical protein